MGMLRKTNGILVLKTSSYKIKKTINLVILIYSKIITEISYYLTMYKSQNNTKEI